MVRFYWVLVFGLIVATGNSQSKDSLSDDRIGTNLKFSPTINCGILVNLQDIYIDFGAGAFEHTSKLGAQLNFAFRPYYKKVQLYEEPNIIRQWKEKKYCLSLDIYKRLLEFDLAKINSSFLLGAKTGYLFGDYRGTRLRPKAGMTFNPFVGVSFDLNGISLDLAYLYFSDRLASVPNGRLMLSFNVILN